MIVSVKNEKGLPNAGKTAKVVGRESASNNQRTKVHGMDKRVTEEILWLKFQDQQAWVPYANNSIENTI